MLFLWRQLAPESVFIFKQTLGGCLTNMDVILILLLSDTYMHVCIYVCVCVLPSHTESSSFSGGPHVFIVPLWVFCSHLTQRGPCCFLIDQALILVLLFHACFSLGSPCM